MHVEGFFHIFVFLCIVRTLLQNIIHDNGNKTDIPDDSCYWLQCICMTYMAQESVSLYCIIDKVSLGLFLRYCKTNWLGSESLFRLSIWEIPGLGKACALCLDFDGGYLRGCREGPLELLITHEHDDVPRGEAHEGWHEAVTREWSHQMYGELRPPLEKMLFPVQRPGESIRCDWRLLFFIFAKKKKISSKNGQYFQC